jgi:hypothetical protein
MGARQRQRATSAAELCVVRTIRSRYFLSSPLPGLQRGAVKGRAQPAATSYGGSRLLGALRSVTASHPFGSYRARGFAPPAMVSTALWIAPVIPVTLVG